MSEEKEQLLQDTLLFCKDLICHLTRDGYDLTKRYMGLETRAKRLFVPDLKSSIPTISTVNSRVLTPVSEGLVVDSRSKERQKNITERTGHENSKKQLPF